MADTIADKVASYLSGLSATNVVCSNFGATLIEGTNLFIGVEPEKDESISIIPYGGAPPVVDRYSEKYNSNFQVRLKMKKRKDALQVQQDIINLLHSNDKVVTKGKVFALQSSPILLGVREGGESIITVSNYSVKHVKF